MSLFKRDTLPTVGAYEFSWTHQGYLEITNRAGGKETYSVDALSRLAGSSGTSKTVRDMASAALDWTVNHPLTRSSHAYYTTPSL